MQTPPFEFVFENDHVVIVDKPSGFLSVPSRLGLKDDRPVVGILLQDYLQKKIFPVHRLDEETSGLLVFAKTPRAQSCLNRGFEVHEIQKTYEALTVRVPAALALKNQMLQNNLFRGKKRSFEAPHGKQAITLVADIQLWGAEHFLWRLEPRTGRSHQLRVQLAMRGFPILGDDLYGASPELPVELKLPLGSKRESAIALRAIKLDFSMVPDIQLIRLPKIVSVEAWSES
jgi:23S rRNA-/tRNA-specific pseudouridylate synthase